MPGRSPDEHMLALRQVDQLRTDVANLESWSGILDAADQSATDRAGSVVGIVGIEAFWPYFACGSI